MKTLMRTISWKFNDCTIAYPETPNKKVYIKSSQDVYENFAYMFRQQVRERFVVFWLNSANRVIGFEIITEGLLNSSLTHPREVFRGAIVATCASIIIAHNHPSGNLEPSAEDLSITNQIVSAGKLLGIPVHDHIIFTDESYTSFAEKGLI